MISLQIKMELSLSTTPLVWGGQKGLKSLYKVIVLVAQSAGAVEYTDYFSAEG